MYIRNNTKFGKDIKIIHPGEYYVSGENEIIGTLLGSCVAVCLVDLEKGVAGMNHFMLPGRITTRDIFSDKQAKYGITAINRLLSDMLAMGCKRENIVAKVFGGGHVLESIQSSSSISDDNVRLANLMMEIEDIPITESDTGSNYTRKLLLDVKTGKVYLKKSTRKDVIDEIGKEEKEYARRSFPNE
ncbi:MAG: chemotaxis protein CheD [Spirochaetes bacterium]|nr:chemotaxis protein CheD [Spirochaetota bacterium]